ncbi:diguanylate cyclase domain-containing protein [Oceanobacter mangrovi]|uniref:diguanylate cyclase domain-containing protein n=1 Tax=Oceanobacter mangrovi TaxID=2862510 RepID=UPI001C8DFDAE|nr:diguanylate cyclase [Oceanobacter mangrovi]
MLVLLAGLIGIRLVWLYPQELADSVNQQQQEISGLAEIIDASLDELGYLARGYAESSEVLQMLRNDEANQIFELFSVNQLIALGLTSASLLRLDGSTLFRAHLQGETESINLDSNSEWLKSKPGKASGGGMILDIRQIDDQPTLIAISPVLADPQHQELSGWIVLTRPLQNRQLSQSFSQARILAELVSPASLPAGQPVTDLRAPIERPASQHQRCLTNLDGNAELCMIIHHHVAPPAFFDQRLGYTLAFALLLPILLLLLIDHALLPPIRQATRMLERNARNNQLKPVLFNTRIPVQELSQLKDAYNELVYKVMRQQSQLKTLSATDPLTQIPNRLAFDRTLEATWSRILRRSSYVAMVLVDIDHFKEYNDHYGHQAGDLALRQVASALMECAKRTDELVARYGGEEFAMIVYLQDATELENFRKLIRRTIRKLEICHEYSPTSPQLTVSAGIAWILDSGLWLQKCSPRDWVQLADIALYEAKREGRNCSMLQLMHREVPKTSHHAFFNSGHKRD